MTRDQIKYQVQAKLAEITPFDSGEVVDDTLLEEMLDPATRKVLLTAPLEMITGTTLPTTGHRAGTDGTGYIPVPNDYLRIHTFKMTEWGQPVHEVIRYNDPRYEMQKYEFMRGTPQKPILTEIYNSDGRCIKYYTVSSAYTIDIAYYVKEVVAGTDLQENLVEMLAWQSAGDILAALGDERAQLAYTKVQEFINDNR